MRPLLCRRVAIASVLGALLAPVGGIATPQPARAEFWSNIIGVGPDHPSALAGQAMFGSVRDVFAAMASLEGGRVEEAVADLRSAEALAVTVVERLDEALTDEIAGLSLRPAVQDPVNLVAFAEAAAETSAAPREPATIGDLLVVSRDAVAVYLASLRAFQAKRDKTTYADLERHLFLCLEIGRLSSVLIEDAQRP